MARSDALSPRAEAAQASRGEPTVKACRTGHPARSRTKPASSLAEKAVAAITRSGERAAMAPSSAFAASGSFRLDTASVSVSMPRSRRACARASNGAVSPPRTAER